MSFDVLLQVLRTLEGLLAEVTSVRLQWDVNTNVRGDVVPFDGSSTTAPPGTSQAQIVG